MDKEVKELDLLIIGGGPAGLTAAIYASRAKINMILLENQLLGGQVRNSYTIENYPGFKEISGGELADIISDQARTLGANIQNFSNIISVKLSDAEKIIETKKVIYKPKAVIIASGATPKKLPISNEEKYSSKWIHYCAVCDEAIYEGSVVGVVGVANQNIYSYFYAETLILMDII